MVSTHRTTHCYTPKNHNVDSLYCEKLETYMSILGVRNMLYKCGTFDLWMLMSFDIDN